MLRRCEVGPFPASVGHIVMVPLSPPPPPQSPLILGHGMEGAGGIPPQDPPGTVSCFSLVVTD